VIQKLDSSVRIVTVFPGRARDFKDRFEAHLACYSVEIVGKFRGVKTTVA